MEESRKSSLLCEEMEFTLESYGKDKTDALGTIFGSLKKRAYQAVDGLIIHMEPKDVFILEESEKSTAQKVAGFFKPKQIQNYYVKVTIVVTIKYIKA